MLDVAVEVARRDLTVDVAFAVAPGERLALFGPSGAGKTTILEVVAGLVAPDRGRVVLGGRELSAGGRARTTVPPWRRRVGLLRQAPALFPHLTVRENILYSGRAGAVDARALTRLVDTLEIGELLDARPRALSGGQAHRVALARLLLANHQALLFDEPYAGLDSRLRRVLTDTVREECRVRSVPSVLVAHELIEAQAFADRLGILDGGRILQDGPSTEVVRRPANRRVAELVGYLGFVRVGALWCGVHPERTRPGDAGGAGVALDGLVTAIRPAGAGWEVDVVAADSEITCRVGDDPPVPGSRFSFTALDPPWFDASGRAAPAGEYRRA